MAKRKKNKNKPEVKEKSGGSRAGGLALLLIVGVVAVMTWALLGSGKTQTEVTSNVQLPAYAFVSARSEQSYRVSLDPLIQNGDVFSKIPCYCGCVGVGHTSLKDCFLDEHGSFCNVCQFEALETYEMIKQGASIAEIRSTIDQRYGGGGFGEGTKTPPVA
jgi:hypothetical protein